VTIAQVDGEALDGTPLLAGVEQELETQGVSFGLLDAPSHPSHGHERFGLAHPENPEIETRHRDGEGLLFFSSRRSTNERWIVGVYGKPTIYGEWFVPDASDLEANVTAPRDWVVPFMPSSYVRFDPARHLRSDSQGWTRYFTYIEDVHARRILERAYASYLGMEDVGGSLLADRDRGRRILSKMLRYVGADPRQVSPGRPTRKGSGAAARAQLLFDEGGRRIVSEARIERNPRLVQLKKQLCDDLRCEVCGFDFERVYGDHGKGFIECHHKNPVKDAAKRRKVH